MLGRRIDRYVVGPEIASGGMASVHLARMLGKGGFGKTVALKHLHAHYARDPEFVASFQDEARVTSGLNHPNVVMTLDVLEDLAELYLVMEYVHGASLSQIQRRLTDQAPVPIRISAGIVAGMLDGLHAAHEATDENGAPLHIIHRDVSPQNVLVTFQGVAKIADFGIARAAGRVRATDDGAVKGKIGYMAPEQLLGSEVTPRTDVYAAGIVLWEAITGRRLIDFDSTAENLRAVLELTIDVPSSLSADLPPELDAIVMRAVRRDPAERFASAKEMGLALRKAIDVAHPPEISDWLRTERPHIIVSREQGLADLQRVIAAWGGAPMSRISAPNIIAEVPTAISPSDDKRSREEEEDRASSPSYWTGARQLTRETRWFFPTLTLVFAFGMASVTFFLLTRPPPREQPVSSTAAREGVASAREPGLSSVPSAPSVPASSASAEETTPPAAVSAAPSTKPRPLPPPATSTHRCHIVPMTDTAGHTKFTEVCP